MKKIYVITGSTSGIGKEILKIFAKNKDNIIFAGYRNKDKIPHNPAENVIYFYIDLTDDNSITEAAKFIKSKTDKIHTLINVAGNVIAGPIERINVKRLREQFDINTFSHIEFTQNLLDIMEDSKIINISSMSSFGHFPFISPYCASKRALDIFFNALAIENKKNIQVVSVKPGVIATPIWEKSVDANMKYFDSCQGYEKELEYVKNNALKNTDKGLPAIKVAQLVEKIDKLKNPKASYTIGKDALFASMLSLLPQTVINKIIKFGIRSRIK